MILENKDFYDPTKKALETIERVVCSTLGAAGRFVIVPKPIYQNGQLVGEEYAPSKDGILVLSTMANNLGSTDPFTAQIAKMLLGAIDTQWKDVGDGTTTATLFASKFYQLMYDELAANPSINTNKLVEKYKHIVKTIVQGLEKQRRFADTEDVLVKIATISANNQKDIGELVGKTIFAVGKHGKTTCRISQESGIRVEMIKGYGLKGAQSKYWLGVHGNSRFDRDDCSLLITTDAIDRISQLHNILRLSVANKDKPLIVVCHNITDECVRNVQADNHSRGIPHNIVFIKHGIDDADQKHEFFRDLAFISNAHITGKVSTIPIDKVNASHLGQLKAVRISDRESIFEFDEDKRDMKNYVRILQAEADNIETKQERKDWLLSRISKLIGSNAVIHIGGLTSSEKSMSDDFFDDAVKTTMSALIHGYLLGGGKAFVNFFDDATNIFDDRLIETMMSICFAPFNKMLLNSGVEDTESLGEGSKGIDFFTGKIIDYDEHGIFDSYMSQVSAINVGLSFAAGLIQSRSIFTQ